MGSIPKIDTHADAPEPTPPRAFAQGTGVLLQTIGMVMFLSTCCVCSLAGLWDPMLSRPQIIEQLRQNQPIGVTLADLLDQPAQAGAMLMVMLMTVGGLAMAGFGLGLQSDRPRSAGAAMATNLLLLAVLALAGTGIWVGDSSWLMRVWHGLFVVMVLTATGFTWVALREVRASPPPPPPPAPPLPPSSGHGHGL